MFSNEEQSAFLEDQGFVRDVLLTDPLRPLQAKNPVVCVRCRAHGMIVRSGLEKEDFSEEAGDAKNSFKTARAFSHGEDLQFPRRVFLMCAKPEICKFHLE